MWPELLCVLDRHGRDAGLSHFDTKICLARHAQAFRPTGRTMRVLLYINLIAILVVMAALGRMYEGTPLPWKVDVLGMVAG